MSHVISNWEPRNLLAMSHFNLYSSHLLLVSHIVALQLATLSMFLFSFYFFLCFSLPSPYSPPTYVPLPSLYSLSSPYLPPFSPPFFFSLFLFSPPSQLCLYPFPPVSLSPLPLSLSPFISPPSFFSFLSSPLTFTPLSPQEVACLSHPSPHSSKYITNISVNIYL